MATLTELIAIVAWSMPYAVRIASHENRSILQVVGGVAFVLYDGVLDCGGGSGGRGVGNRRHRSAVCRHTMSCLQVSVGVRCGVWSCSGDGGFGGVCVRARAGA